MSVIKSLVSGSGSGAVAMTTADKTTYKLKEVRLTLSAATTDLDDFTISLDSSLGSTYDTVLSAPDSDEDLTEVTSFRYADVVPPVIFPEDSLVITWPNVGSVTWSIDVIVEQG